MIVPDEHYNSSFDLVYVCSFLFRVTTHDADSCRKQLMTSEKLAIVETNTKEAIRDMYEGQFGKCTNSTSRLCATKR